MILDDVLKELARDPQADFDLAEVALCLAKDEYPKLDVEGYLGELAAHAQDARNYVRGPFTARVDGLCRYVFHELGFRGNKKDYYDPRNSYFNQVLERRKGIPITLAAVLMALGRRVGVEVAGVGLPGHFIVKCVGEAQEILVDPFHGGRRLTRVDCEILVKQTTGSDFHAGDDQFLPVPLGRMLQRMLNNLKAIYVQREDWPRCLRVLARLIQLAPDDPTIMRDLGVCHLHQGEPGRAIDCFRVYLDNQPAPADAGAVEGLLQQAQREVARWN
jgi:regulator of sirC expression with transglutaminase-like and TPR domain